MRADQPIATNVSGGRSYFCGLTGASTSDPTKNYGDGITVTRTAAGVLKFTFASHPGYFKGAWCTFGADTPSGVKGYSHSRDTFTAATSSASAFIEISLWDASNNAVDLSTVQYLDVHFLFSELSV